MISDEKIYEYYNERNAKTGVSLGSNLFSGLGPKAVPRPSHGQGRKALVNTYT